MSKENISYLDNMLALYGNRVFSIRNAPADAVYIGRGRGSIFGNPFPMHCEADREKVCIEYRKWLADKIKTSRARPVKTTLALDVHRNASL